MSQYKAMYNSKVWKSLRTKKLFHDPLCEYCKKQGLIEPAFAVDHIKPHKGNWELFSDESNLQSLCETHHNASKQKEEIHNKSIAIGIDGWPVTEQR